MYIPPHCPLWLDRFTEARAGPPPGPSLASAGDQECGLPAQQAAKMARPPQAQSPLPPQFWVFARPLPKSHGLSGVLSPSTSTFQLAKRPFVAGGRLQIHGGVA